MVKLRFEHIVCSAGIGERTVRILELATAIELVRSSKGTRFALVVEHLYINGIMARKVNVHLRTQEFLGKQRKVETIRVETCKVTPLELVCNLTRHILEKRTILHILVINAMDSRSNLGNMHSRVYAAGILCFAAIGINLYVANLHNAVLGDIGTRGLEVKKYYRFLKIQFHLQIPLSVCKHHWHEQHEQFLLVDLLGRNYNACT